MNCKSFRRHGMDSMKTINAQYTPSIIIRTSKKRLPKAKAAIRVKKSADSKHLTPKYNHL
jgi:hypothetical protein